MKSNYLKKLIDKYQSGQLGDDEKQLLDAWMDQIGNQEQASSWSDEEISLLKNRLLEDTQGTITKLPKRKFPWLAIGIAASVLLVLGGFLWIRQSNLAPNQPEEILADNIYSDSPVVLLELDGQEFSLDAGKKGINTSLGELLYSDGSAIEAQKLHNDDQPRWYTLSTPKGSQFSVELPDGSKVWLNAASSLRYPSAFSDTIREVELVGEGYFEVKNEKHEGRGTYRPFVVKAKDQKIYVLGTSFNVKAYASDRVSKTSLLTGKVEVESEGAKKRMGLRPNQQLTFDSTTKALQVREVDAWSCIDWKNNLFSFHNVTLMEIMQEVERWYNVQVDIENWPRDKFYGEVTREAPLSEILNMIENSSPYRFKVIQQSGERRVVMR